MGESATSPTWKEYRPWFSAGENALANLRAIPPQDILIFDLETTGLSPKRDEILQVAVIDGTGAVRLSTYMRPTHTESWEQAFAVNGITGEMVAEAPTLAELKPQLVELFRSAKLIVGYNHTGFDLRFLDAAGIHMKAGTLYFDAAFEFGPLGRAAQLTDHPQKQYRLTAAAQYFGYTYRAHDALEDAKATLFVMQHLSPFA